MEILNYGIGGPQSRRQRLRRSDAERDHPTPAAPRQRQRAAHAVPGIGRRTKNSSDWWPNVLFDPREALLRDTAPRRASNVTLGGVMYYVTIDVGNLAKWFKGTAPLTTPDRRQRQGRQRRLHRLLLGPPQQPDNAASTETGEYGFEDFVNPTCGQRRAERHARPGEDVNANRPAGHLRQRSELQRRVRHRAVRARLRRSTAPPSVRPRAPAPARRR